MRQLNLMRQRLMMRSRLFNINDKVKRVLDKVLSKLKRVDQKLQAIQLITSQNITAGRGRHQWLYINKRIYTNQVQLFLITDFYNSINILAQTTNIYKCQFRYV